MRLILSMSTSLSGSSSCPLRCLRGSGPTTHFGAPFSSGGVASDCSVRGSAEAARSEPPPSLEREEDPPLSEEVRRPSALAAGASAIRTPWEKERGVRLTTGTAVAADGDSGAAVGG